MKKLIFTACAMLTITACTSKDDPEKTGQMYLSQARDYLGFERFKEARAAIDSLRDKSPRAFNAREEGILLLDSIDLFEARKDLEKTEKALALNPKGDLKDSLDFDKEEAQQKITFFTKKLAHDKANFKKH